MYKLLITALFLTVLACPKVTYYSGESITGCNIWILNYDDYGYALEIAQIRPPGGEATLWTGGIRPKCVLRIGVQEYYGYVLRITTGYISDTVFHLQPSGNIFKIENGKATRIPPSELPKASELYRIKKVWLDAGRSTG